MKRPVQYFLALIFIVSVYSAEAQTSSDNYVKVYKAQQPHASDLTTINDKDEVSESVVYYDGLGRELQSVSRQGSPSGHDMVTFSKYDEYGKKIISYLPYVADQNTGAPVADPLADQVTFYQSLFGMNDGKVALSQTVIERSELSRVIEQASPGDAWKKGSDHTITKEYLTNTTADEILKITYSTTTGLSVTPDDFYDDYSLTVTKTTDEEQNDVIEFVDKEGRTICKKVKAPGGVYASTYYVYDNFGSLVVVLPPEAVQRIIDANEN